MATKKKFLQAAAGTAAASSGGGAAGLNVEQLFSIDIWDGNGGSTVIQNGINLGQSNDGGSAEFDGGSGYLSLSDGSAFDVGSSDDYTVEMFVFFLKDPSNGSIKYLYDGKESNGTGGSTFFLAQENTNDWSTDGMTSSAFSSSDFTDGQWYHIAVTRSGGTLRTFKDGTLINSVANTSSFNTDQFNIGARYSNNYILSEAVISNFRFVNGTALYTSSFTVPTSELTAVSNTAILTCKGDSPFTDHSSNANTVNVNGTVIPNTIGPFDASTSGEGGMVWIKNRTGVRGNQQYDTERGTGLVLSSNAQDAETTRSNGLTSFNSNGFNVGNHAASNTNTQSIVAWSFRKAEKFFDCVKFTGDGNTEQAVGHNLGVAPGCYAIKRLDGTSNWYFYTTVIDGSHDYMFLDEQSAKADSSRTAPTSTHVYPGSILNTNGAEYIIYMWANNNSNGIFGETEDQDIIRCGTFTGTTGTFVNLGFEPQWILAKNVEATQDWYLIDTIRGSVRTNDQSGFLLPNSSAAETRSANGFTIRPDGFEAFNAGGATYFYLAIRRGPMATPTDANDVFAVSYPQSAPSMDYHFHSGFPIDFSLMKFNIDSTGTYGTPVPTRLIGSYEYPLNATSSEALGAYSGNSVGASTYELDHSDGFFAASAISPPNDVAWMWRSAPSFCAVRRYSGNGSAQNISHGLNAVPEMMWVKNMTGGNSWMVYHKDLGNTSYLKLDDNSAKTTGNSNRWNSTTPTATQFTVGSASATNDSSSEFICYLFASVSGVSVVGSFTGDGTTGRQIDCGFQNGARFILIKAHTTTGNWLTWDTERGIVTGNDPYVLLDTTDGESSAGDNVDPYSAGFIVNGPGNNQSGVGYIFYAIA